jgi:hypothetical protein
MDDQDIGWRNGWADEDFVSEVAGNCISFLFNPERLIQLALSMIHMDQMILSEPSIIIIWTYQDMMGWMSRILVGEMAVLIRT